MAASNRDCTAPTNRIFWSDLTTLIASLMVGLDSESSEELVDATFSFHRRVVRIAPAARKNVESSNGPVGPFSAAAIPESFPARIATMESPA